MQEFGLDFICPILDMKIVFKSSMSGLDLTGYKFTSNSFTIGGDTGYVAYTKTRVKDSTNYEPIIGTEINTGIPCYGPDKNRLILSIN